MYLPKPKTAAAAAAGGEVEGRGERGATHAEALHFVFDFWTANNAQLYAACVCVCVFAADVSGGFKLTAYI